MHNDTWYKGGKDYIYAIKDFIDKASEYRMNRDNPNRNSIGAASGSGPNMPNQGGSSGA
jgi:Iap family predicted aminopeptidase